MRDPDKFGWFPFLTRELRVCARASCRYDVGNSTRSLDWSIPVHLFSILGSWEPWKYQPVALYAISPISMELCQFKGCTLKLKQANWFLFWLFPWIERLLYRFFLVFTKEIASKWGKCMKLSLRWYLTYYSEGLHRYCYILDKCTT